MLSPEHDLQDRQPVWDAMQILFMDTDPDLFVDSIARTCAASKYSLDELEAILFQEVLPACRFNLFTLPGGEWRGFELEWLTARILEKHRFGKRRPLILRRYTRDHWEKIRGRISALRDLDG